MTTIRRALPAALATLVIAPATEAFATSPPVCPEGPSARVTSGAQVFVRVRPCTDPDGGPVRLSILQPPAHGRAWMYRGSYLGYRPDSGYAGADVVRLLAVDQASESTEVRVVVRVTAGRRTRTPGKRESARSDGYALCSPRRAGEQCGPGRGRRTAGGGGTGKVTHKGWPAVTGILWKVTSNGRGDHAKTGGPDNDELLGHHGDDTLYGGAGHDILWGDWDPKNNNTSQRDRLRGGSGNDWLYSSHGSNDIDGGAGTDHVWAYYGRGSIDCGPGAHDVVRIRLGAPYSVRNCETIGHFCAYGPDGHGGCLKPGEARSTRRREL